MLAKKITCIAVCITTTYFAHAQGCSDAGFCTAGNFNAHTTATKAVTPKNEIDISFNYGTHGKNEVFCQPQINYRAIKGNGSFFEVRLPLNSIKNTGTNQSNSGIGDIMASYNNNFVVTKSNKIDYSIGLRISLTDAAKKDTKNNGAYPMYLQTGLGTTDLIAVVNYDIVKYLSIGTGVQIPIIQYNKHEIIPYNTLPIPPPPRYIGYRRKPDALLKLTGHYQTGKLKINGGILSIFHLANDYYNSSAGNYSLANSKGTTLNWTVDFTYSFSRKLGFSLLYAEPFKTRKNIPDGLARSRIINPKFTFAF